MIKALTHYALPVLFAVMGLVSFTAYGIDKHKARKHRWRIPEKTLFALNLLGGFIGGWLGMFTFRHKTKHPSFYIVQTLAAVLWVGLTVWLMMK